jgi:hypothetical protein
MNENERPSTTPKAVGEQLRGWAMGALAVIALTGSLMVAATGRAATRVALQRTAAVRCERWGVQDEKRRCDHRVFVCIVGAPRRVVVADSLWGWQTPIPRLLKTGRHGAR